MPRSEEKTISVRMNEDLVDQFDRAVVQAKADGNLPMDYNRSEAVRDFFKEVADNPDLLLEFVDQD